jgi:hypothetical protein
MYDVICWPSRLESPLKTRIRTILQTRALEEGVSCEAGITPWLPPPVVGGATQAVGVAFERPVVRDQLQRSFTFGSILVAD